MNIDRKLFDRLNWGPLGPITLTLKDGGAVIGETKGIARGSADGLNGDNDCWGRVLMAANGCDVEVDYITIAAIT